MHFARVITVDVKGSKKLKDRAVVQNKILNVLNSLNKEFNEFLIADFMITLGDEFQGVLKTTKSVLKIFKHIKENLFLPVEFCCGVGVGSIETP